MARSAAPTSENEILRFLEKRFSGKSRFLKKGIGDDAAVLRLENASEFWLVTTDMLAENIDFRREWTTPRQLGRKSLSVNLSDLAAMGARPRFYTVSLGLPPGISGRWIAEFYRGLTEQGDAHAALLIGGDLSGSESGIQISITAIGESAGRRLLYRSGGREGDFLYVTGILGRSAAGLRLLQSGCLKPRGKWQREALERHRRPDPRCASGMWLAQSGMVRCMMDLSDGLSVDLPRMCAACGVGAEIDAAGLPVFADALSRDWDPVSLALHGGEDFELLFAVAASKAALLEDQYPRELPPVTRIGKLIRGRGKIWIHSAGRNRRRLEERGYDHFRRNALRNRRRRDGAAGTAHERSATGKIR